MKIIFVIPHFYKHDERGVIGSRNSPPAERAAVLERCLTSLRQTFGMNHGLVNSGQGLRQANSATSVRLKIVVCTSGDYHLLKELPSGIVDQHKVPDVPAALGFACHRILKGAVGEYDYYCFLEDDIEITDALFFRKLAWFSANFGNDAVLQPNRFEISLGPPLWKLYLDGNTFKRDAGAAFQDVTDRPKLSASGLGADWLFQRVGNPHSGGFFLNAQQMAVLAGKSDFGVYTTAFHTALESAATLPIMRHFRVYKPARENAAFLEMRHLGQRFLPLRHAPQGEAAAGAEARSDPVP
jgi:hypothetical protein